MKNIEEKIEEKISVNSNHLSHISESLKNSVAFTLVTAFKADQTLTENVKLNRELSNNFQNMGYGHLYVNGHFCIFGEKYRKKHDVVFVMCSNEEKIDDLLHDTVKVAFGEKYGQNKILFSENKENMTVIERNSSRKHIEKPPTLNNIVENYITTDNGFYVFESVRPTTNMGKKYSDPYGWI